MKNKLAAGHGTGLSTGPSWERLPLPCRAHSFVFMWMNFANDLQLPTLLHSCQEVEGFAWLVSWLRNLAPLCLPVLATLFTSSTSHDTSLSASPLFETRVGRGTLTVDLLKPSSTALSSAATQNRLLCPYTHLSHYLIWKPQFRGNGNPWSGGRDWAKSVIPSVFSLGQNIFLPLTYSS